MGADRRSRILVIDDDLNVRELVCEQLRRMGYEAHGTADGPNGLALLDRGRYDLVLTDLVMPGMSGWDVVEAVRRRAPTMPVILISGSATGVDADRAREAGLTLLQKPFSLQGLKTVVSQALEPRVS